MKKTKKIFVVLYLARDNKTTHAELFSKYEDAQEERYLNMINGFKNNEIILISEKQLSENLKKTVDTKKITIWGKRGSKYIYKK